jgi:putative transposase
VRRHRPLPANARLGAAVLSRSCGRWFVGLPVERPDAEPRQDFAPVGIDLGLSALAALSTGETVPTPPITKNAAALRRHQRKLSRAKRGSRGRKAARASLARFQAKLAAQRRDGLHKLSCDLTRRFSHLAMEDLNVKGLAGGMLAKAVHNAAWGTLAGMIAYKAANAGGQVVLVDPRGTSRTCPACGAVAAKSLAMRVHGCECGCVLDRDVAAAREILRRAAFTQPGTGCGTPSRRVAAWLVPEAAFCRRRGVHHGTGWSGRRTKACHRVAHSRPCCPT